VHGPNEHRATRKVEGQHVASYQIANNAAWRLKALAGRLRSGELCPSPFQRGFAFAEFLGVVSRPDIEVTTLVNCG
jgi:hypothetical protein